jgi:gliding motility-associated-like protein
MILKKYYFLAFILLSSIVNAQVAVNDAVTVNDLVTAISGPGVIISNPTLNCPTGAFATFSGGTGNLGITDGILLTTGTAANAVGPNNSVSTSGGPCSSATDPDLTAIEPQADQDVCILEFDVIPQCDILTLDYVFGSEEYPEFVGGSYNDAFGFFLSGPIPGGGNYVAQNVAVLPGAAGPVSIDNVNGGSNAGYYVDNTAGVATQYDGLTTLLTATMPVVQCQTYHMKLIIADAGDCSYDSGVFLDFEGLVCPNSDATLNPIVVEAAENCIDASFEIIANFAVATTVNITTTGSATNGVDFVTPGSYNLPAGPSTTSITISPFADGLVEGTETMNIILSYDVCGTLVYDTLPMTILDQPTINFNSTIENCGECDGTASATFNNAALPIASYTWLPAPGGGQGTPNITGLCQGTYVLDIIDANGCPAIDSVVIGTACAPCNIDSLTLLVGACQPATSTYDLSGNIYFSNAPSTGTLTVTDCNGNADTLMPPFVSPFAYSLTGLTADGLACDVTATFSDDLACNASINYNAPASCNPNCAFTSISDTIGFCDPITNLFPRYGEVTFSDAPATGLLIFTDCVGNADTLFPPFTSPAYYYFEANSNGTLSCDVTAQFTADPACNINIAQDYPVACGCPADAGTTVAGVFGDGQMDYVLCYNDTIIIASNGNDISPDDVGPIGGSTYNPGITYGIYNCPPTPNTSPDLDPCYTGFVTGTITNFGDVNDGGLLGFLIGQGFTFTNNTVYFAPLTLYNQDDLVYNSGCVNVGLATAVTYLPEITISNPTPDCQDSSFTITINGGYPELIGGNFTASNLLPATASFVNTTTPNGGTIQINGLLDGDMYSFDIADTNGCPITVTGGPFVGLPNANAGADDTTCTLTYVMSAIPSVGTGIWTAQAGVNVAPANSATGTATATAPGTYELYWTENNTLGCTDVDTVVISFSNLSYTTTLIQPTCGNANGTITVNAINGVTPYQYSNDSALTYQALDSFPNLAEGSYDVFVVDALGCVQSSDEVLIDSNSPVIDSLSLTQPLCNGDLNGGVVVHATGGGTPYQYSIDAGVLQSDSTFTGLTGATPYLFTVEDSFGCTDTMSTVLIDPILLVLDSAIGTDVVCNGDDDGTISIYAQGGTGTLSYSIDSGATFVASAIFNGLAPKTYGVVVQDANNCQQTIDVVIDEPLPISIPNLVDSVVCFGTSTGQIQVLPQGGISPYTYGWAPSGGTGTIASNLSAGAYTVTVTDANLCQQDSIFTIYEPAQFVYTTDLQNSNCNQPDGWAAVISFAGGTGNYTYVWDAAAGNQTTDTAFNLIPGNYDVTITDGNLCDTTLTVTVGNNPSFTTNITGVVNATCNTYSDGEATANGSDPLATYSYSWSTVPVQNTQTATGLSAGTYYVTVTDDATGCFENDSVVITEPTPVTINSVSPNVSICAAQTTDITATATGGSGTGYVYTWDNGLGVSQTHTVSPAPGTAITYQVWTVDGIGCPSDTGDVTVTVTPELSVSIPFPDVDKCPYDAVTIGAVGSLGNGGPYTYTWTPNTAIDNPNIQNPTVNPTTNTVYTVEINDGCSPAVFEVVNVNNNPLPNPLAVADTLRLCEQPVLPFTFYNTTDTTNGMLDTTQVTWYFGDGSSAPGGPLTWDSIQHTYNGAGTYTISMTAYTTAAQGGCTLTQDVAVVVVNPLPNPDFTSNPNPTTMFEPEVDFLDITPDNIGIWEWDFAGLGTSPFPNPSFEFPNDTVGEYPVTLTVTDANGCVNNIVKIVIVKGEYGLFVPNTFTPDFDNKNDVFLAKGFGISDEGFNLSIYDRWGEKIFEANDIDDGWDGTYKGTMVKTDTYVWKIIYKDVNGEQHSKIGHVNIIQ